MTTLYPLNLRIFAKNGHVTTCTLFRILGIYKQFILRVTCLDVVEHQLKRFIIRLITTHVQIIVVKIPTARLVNISDVCRLVAAVQLMRMLRVRINFEALTLHDFPSLQYLICSWIGGYWPLFYGAGWPRIKLISIIRRQLCPTLQNIMALIIVADIHLTLIIVLLHRVVRYGVPRRKQTRLVHLHLAVGGFSAVHHLCRRIV